MQGRTVLLVEDNAINRQVAGEFLKDIGLIVEEAHNGREAFKKAITNEYDLILMDIQMPEMDGLTATSKIRAVPGLADLPILAITAHAMITDRDKSIKAGMNDHITKPINPEDLYHTLLKWIQETKVNKLKKKGIIQMPSVPTITGIVRMRAKLVPDF